MLTRYWDDARACFAYGEVIFDGREWAMEESDRRFWSQREPVLGGGNLEIGQWPTPKEVQRVKDLPPLDTAPNRKRRQRVTFSRCGCGRVRPKAAPYCWKCTERGVKIRRRPKERQVA